MNKLVFFQVLIFNLVIYSEILEIKLPFLLPEEKVLLAASLVTWKSVYFP